MSNPQFYAGAAATMQQQQQQQLSLMHQQQQLRLNQFQQEHQQRQHQQQQQLASMAPRTVLSSQPFPTQHHVHQQQHPSYITTAGLSSTQNMAHSLASPPYDSNNNSSSNHSNMLYGTKAASPATVTAMTAVAAAAAAVNWDTAAFLANTNTNTSANVNNLGKSQENNPMALSIGPDGSLVAASMVPRWDSAYSLNTGASSNTLQSSQQQQLQQLQQQAHPSIMGRQQPQQQRQLLPQQQPPQQMNLMQENKSAHFQQHPQPQDLFANDYLFDAPSPVPTMSSLDIGIPLVPAQHQQHPQQFHSSPSPLHIPEYIQQSSSPDVPIKTSPVDNPLVWAPWGDTTAHLEEQVVYATPADTHTSFDENSRDDSEFLGTKHLKVFTSSKKDDDGEFRKGQQFYLNVHLSPEDRERYRYLRIPTENIVLPCRADSAGRISLNASGKRSADAMSTPTSAQEEDVLSMKLTTFLEPEHRPVVPCGRCKDKTPEILRFHPGVNGKPMIDENGMVTLREGQIKLIASAWCASTSHHRGPGTKFSFEIELTSMMGGNLNHKGPVLVYQGRSDEVEIYASHGRDKGSRSMSKNTDKLSKSQSPPLHESGSAGAGGPPSPAKTSSPPGSPSQNSGHTYGSNHHINNSINGYDTGPVKKRREEQPPPLSPPLQDGDLTSLPPVIKSLEPRKGPICQENHVIIIGQNFARGMIPMFGREYGQVIEINPFYIECTTPLYPKKETVRLWIHHEENFLPSDKTYEFTDEQAQSELEQMLRNMIQESQGGASDFGGNDNGGSHGPQGGNNTASYFSLFGKIAGLPSSTDISGQSQMNGSTLLHNSVLLGYNDGVEILIEEGIELDIEDDSGLTALDYAIHTNNAEITSALLHAGSIVSYDRLNKLPLRPSNAMASLLKDLCNVDLPTRASVMAQDQVPDLGAQQDAFVESPQQDEQGDDHDGIVESGVSRESHTVPSTTTTATAAPVAAAGHVVIQDTILEESEAESDNSSISVATPVPNLPASPASTPVPLFSTATMSKQISNASPSTPAHSTRPLQQQSHQQYHHVAARSSRPMSIATVSTQSTGMVSLANTMSTMAPSATSSMQSRGSSGMMMVGPGGRSAAMVSKGGQENIWQCAKKGNLPLVKYHLDKESSLINTPWKFDGRSVLSSACASPQPFEMVEYLVLQRGAQVHCADTFYKRTPLHVLCEEGGLIQDEWRFSGTTMAEQETNEQDVLATMRFLLDQGAIVDAKNHWKETVLMRLLAGRDCPLMVQELYSRGADSRVKSSKDVYPHGAALAYAAYFGRVKSIKWMVENDVLGNEESSIKDAIRWAKAAKGDSNVSQAVGSSSSSQAQVAYSINIARRKEERKQETIRFLESWLGESGLQKRKALARSILAQQANGWYKRISGIIEEKAGGDDFESNQSSPRGVTAGVTAGGPGGAGDMPSEMRPLWKDVHSVCETLASSSDHVASSSGRKWNPLTMLRKNN
ncbi:hypothetical protein EDD11_009103 [Mortierella claussenii]|nr:hypothetical protein EDD11_009103 [Mortierella claussenii]